MPGIKDGVPLVPGRVDEYSPVHTAKPDTLPSSNFKVKTFEDLS